jgi:hypothetical protein
MQPLVAGDVRTLTYWASRKEIRASSRRLLLLNGLLTGKKTGGQLSPAARNILLIEERYAWGDALSRGVTMGLFDCNMKLKPGGTKFLVEEICSFSMALSQAGAIPKPACSQ